MCELDADSDLELGIALSISEQCVTETEKPILTVTRRKVLPPVSISEKSKKLLRNVYQSDRKKRQRIDAIIEKAFHTLRTLGECRGSKEGTIDVESLGIALKRLGYGVEGDELQEMLSYYSGGMSSAHLSDYSIFTRETVNNTNVDAEWRHKGSWSPQSLELIDIETFKRIFLDCNLRIETNDLIY